MHSTTTPTPARRAVTPHPKLRHLIHHIEPNDTIHALCGLRLHPSNGATIGNHSSKVPCPACDAARHLYEVTL